MATERDNANTLNEAQLDALFDDVAQIEPSASPAFMARIAADMDENLPAPAISPQKLAVPRKPWWRLALEQIGGAPAAAGLAAAGVAGVAIGAVDPASLDTAAAFLGLEVMAYDVDDLFATFPTMSEDGYR